jgi:serine protease Do
VERLKPVVVSIQSTRAVREDSEPGNPVDLFRHFFGQPDEDRDERRHSLGSGFIISGGHIVTNYHVVKGAMDVTVRLDDGRDLKADVVGRDAKTDVALLRLREPPVNLPIARLGDSDPLKVGDWVVAIGNPFGLGHTVTSGIVSAKERFFGAGPYDDFIQTDASINPGNSGGPLFNAQGEVVGVSAAVIEGGQGLGFAIPINIVKNVVTQLEQRGGVVRGWIGIDVQELNPELVDAFHLRSANGALVTSVDDKSPSARAGLHTGDVILEWDGKAVREATRLPLMIAETPPGNRVKVTYMRSSGRRETAIEVGTLHDAHDRQDVAGHDDPAPPPRREHGKLGAQVEDLTPELADRLGLKERHGVLVVSVQPGGAAEGSLEPGDVILEADHRTVASSRSLTQRLERMHKDEVALLRVRRADQFLYEGIRMP